MRTTIAVVGRVSVQCIRAHFDDHPEVLSLAERNVRSERNIKFLKLDNRDERRRGCAAIEAEYRFLICAAGLERSFGRLCVFRCDCSRLRSVLRVTAFGVTAGCDARLYDLGCLRCVCRG